MALLSPLAVAGTAPSQPLKSLAPPLTAAPTPNPYGAHIDQDAIDASHSDSPHAKLDSGLALLAARQGIQSAWNFAVGDDLKVVSDPHQSTASRVFHGALIAANALGPEEFGLKSVGKGVFVAAEHAINFAAGKAPETIGKLVVHQGAKLSPAETDVAAKLVHEGKTVEALPTSRVSGVRTADFAVNGVKTELKTVSNLTSKDVSARVKNTIETAVGQARNVIIDARKQPGFSQKVADATIARTFGGPREDKIDSVRIIGSDFDQTYR